MTDKITWGNATKEQILALVQAQVPEHPSPLQAIYDQRNMLHQYRERFERQNKHATMMLRELENHYIRVDLQEIQIKALKARNKELRDTLKKLKAKKKTAKKKIPNLKKVKK